MSSNISIVGVKKSFGSFEALKGVSLEVASGDFTVLLGPSGCGKTTLLRIVAGLERENSGTVKIGDRVMNKLAPRHRNIAMVFQNYAIFPHMNVFKNVAFGLRMRKTPKAELESKTDRAMEMMHIEELAKRYPSQLSGGQRQRVAVARALACEPEVLLMDEPLSNLDALLRLEMRAELKQLLQATRTTTLYVTHDQTEAMSLASRIAVMHGGVLVQYAPPEEVYSRPATKFVGGFIGNPPMNFIELASVGEKTLAAARKYGVPSTVGDISMGIRPEDLSIVDSPSDETLVLKVAVVEALGSAQHVTGYVDGQLVRVVVSSDVRVAPGSEVALSANHSRVRWFNKNELIGD